MGKLFMLCTDLAGYEAMMQQVPGFNKDKEECLFYDEMLEATVRSFQINGLYIKIHQIIRGGDVGEMLFRDDKHKMRFNNFYKYAEKQCLDVIASNKNIAALFLLSASEYLWKQSKTIITDEAVSIELADIQAATEEVYDIYQAIRFILYGADNLHLEDLAEPEIISDGLVMLITNAFVVNKYGMSALQSKYRSRARAAQA